MLYTSDSIKALNGKLKIRNLEQNLKTPKTQISQNMCHRLHSKKAAIQKCTNKMHTNYGKTQQTGAASQKLHTAQGTTYDNDLVAKIQKAVIRFTPQMATSLQTNGKT